MLLGISTLRSDQLLVPSNQPWSVVGQFKANSAFPFEERGYRVLREQRQDPGLLLWGSWLGDDRLTGRLISPMFKAPLILKLYIAGYPNGEGNQLLLERQDTHAQLALKLLRPATEKWLDTRWLLPLDWQGKPTRLVAVDGSQTHGGWLGISSPLQSNGFSWLQFQLPMLVIPPLYLLHFLLFLVPGLGLAIWLRQHHPYPNSWLVMVGVLWSSLLGYLGFWIYFLNYILGFLFSLGIILTSGIVLGQSVRHRFPGSERSQSWRLPTDILVPLLLMFCTGLVLSRGALCPHRTVGETG
ncbi:hypothetical protein DO97_13330 [Neosynechococcus sphagnicola sy1]|uniref:Uncharacterized protein n=2 Tax=Neosynechococcus TaxID=1501143 RepID=A0A098TJ38_9CYAN|nr:hypothetical protein DO97_13330 [Neosynechococcus sphagnicola sy1]